MQCQNPIYLKKEKIFVPCWKCRHCKISRAREWATRIIHESKYHTHNVFVTITYNDEHLPNNNSIVKRDMQLFIKRFRKSISPRKIKYYGCGEYGEENNRAHYHLILFNVGIHDFTETESFYSIKSKKMEKSYTHSAWKYGRIHIGTVTYQSARYVADYVQKSYNGQLGKKIYTDTGREIPFQIYSQGLGQQYCIDNAIKLTQMLGDTINGNPVGLPRYYRKKLEIPSTDLYTKRLERDLKHTRGGAELDEKRYLQTRARFGLAPDPNRFPVIINKLDQQEKNAIAQQKRATKKTPN